MRRFWYRVCYVIARVGLFFWHPAFHVQGRENIPTGRCIYCANHASMSDPLWFLLALNADDLIHIIAKKELSRVFFVGWVMRRFGIIFVERGKHDAAAVTACVDALESGGQLLLFPEGTRWKKGKQMRAHTGAVRMAVSSQSPLVPVYITRVKKPFAPILVRFGAPYLLPSDAQQQDRAQMQGLADALLRKIYQLGGDSYADHFGEDGGLLLRR